LFFFLPLHPVPVLAVTSFVGDAQRLTSSDLSHPLLHETAPKRADRRHYSHLRLLRHPSPRVLFERKLLDFTCPYCYPARDEPPLAFSLFPLPVWRHPIKLGDNFRGSEVIPRRFSPPLAPSGLASSSLLTRSTSCASSFFLRLSLERDPFLLFLPFFFFIDLFPSQCAPLLSFSVILCLQKREGFSLKPLSLRPWSEVDFVPSRPSLRKSDRD